MLRLNKRNVNMYILVNITCSFTLGHSVKPHHPAIEPQQPVVEHKSPPGVDSSNSGML